MDYAGWAAAHTAQSPSGDLLVPPGAERNEPVERGLEAVRDAEVFVLVALDHQLVHQHGVAVGDRLHRLHAQRHDGHAALVDLHLALVPRDAVHPVGTRGTTNLEITPPVKLAVLVLGEDLLEQRLSALLGGPPVLATPQRASGLLHEHAVRRAAQQPDDQENEQQLERGYQEEGEIGHPPATRGTITT